MINEFDTIAAIATAVSNAGIGIIRISGSEAMEILVKIFEPYNKKADVYQLENHRIYYGNIKDGEEVVDECIVLIMKGPHSYTKEDGTKVYALDVVMNEHYFADDKIPEEAHNNNNPQQPVNSLKDPNYDPIPMPNNNQATGNTNSMADSMSMPAMNPIPEVPTVEPAFNGTEMEIPGELLEDLPIGE